jgi:hypothetical protein
MKHCECGCGRQTTKAKYTETRRGVKKGEYRRFIRGHGAFKHGMIHTRTYKAWLSMKKRCLNKNTNDYKYYGGRGIKVCARWMKFENFYADMGDAPKGLTIERQNNNGNYELGNCQWATRSEQSKNRRGNRIIEFNSKSMCLNDWAKSIGINHASLRERLDKWPLERALTEQKRNI